MYGMPISGVEPIEPTIGEFRWDAHEYASTEGDNALQAFYDPPPAKTPPPNCWYPQAPYDERETHHLGVGHEAPLGALGALPLCQLIP